MKKFLSILMISTSLLIFAGCEDEDVEDENTIEAEEIESSTSGPTDYPSVIGPTESPETSEE
ncbi:MAG: hypothetical protein Q8P27_03660 [Candidatus Peregrinibacteria bacterium]|nr:hypothetical protein [Candidatus Peregrinibacteria bacterium]